MNGTKTLALRAVLVYHPADERFRTTATSNDVHLAKRPADSLTNRRPSDGLVRRAEKRPDRGEKVAFSARVISRHHTVTAAAPVSLPKVAPPPRAQQKAAARNAEPGK